MADPIQPGATVGGGSAYGAMLAPRTREVQAPLTRTWRFPSTAVSVRALRHELRPFLRESGLPDAETEDLLLATCEAATNGIEHARNPTQPFLDVEAEVHDRQVRIVVRDYGRWSTVRAERGDRGRGLRMMTLLAVVSVTSGPMGTQVTLRNIVGGGPAGRA